MSYAVVNAQLTPPHPWRVSVLLARNSSWNAVLSRCPNHRSGLCALCTPRDNWEVLIPLSLKPAWCFKLRHNFKVPPPHTRNANVTTTLRVLWLTYGYFVKVWRVWCRWYWRNVACQQLMRCGFAFGLCSGLRVFMTDSDSWDKCHVITVLPYCRFLLLDHSKSIIVGCILAYIQTLIQRRCKMTNKCYYKTLGTTIKLIQRLFWFLYRALWTT
jgi:hypothetical protein